MSTDWSAENFFIRTANWIGFSLKSRIQPENNFETHSPDCTCTKKEPSTEAKTGFRTFGTVTALFTRRAKLKEFVSQRKKLFRGNLDCVNNVKKKQQKKKVKGRIKETKKNKQRDGVFNTFHDSLAIKFELRICEHLINTTAYHNHLIIYRTPKSRFNDVFDCLITQIKMLKEMLTVQWRIRNVFRVGLEKLKLH